MAARHTDVYKLDISRDKIEFLKDKPSAKQLLIANLRAKGHVISFDLDQLQVTIESDSDTDTSEDIKFIDDQIVEMEIRIRNELFPFLDNLKFPNLQNECLEVIVIQADSQRQCVKVVGFPDGVNRFMQRLNSCEDRVIKRTPSPKSPQEDETKRRNRSVKIYEKLENLDGDCRVCISTGGTADSQLHEVKKSTFYCKAASMIDALRGQAANVGRKYNCDVQCSQKRSLRVTPNQARVSVEFGQVQAIKADAIIVSTNPKLTMAMGNSISDVIIRAAGKGIQEELRTNYPKELQYGDVAKSGSGDISTCKAIYHGVLPVLFKDRRNKDECYKALVTVVLNALLMASTDGYTSVGFPALGTGILSYPEVESVQLLFLAVSQFFQCALSSIENIIFVICHKADPFITQLYLMETFSCQLHTEKINDPTQVHVELHKDATKMYETRFQIGNIVVQISNGDISAVCDVTKVVLVLWRQDYITQYKENPIVLCFDESVQNHIYSKYVPLLKEKDTKFVLDSTSLSNTRLIHLYCKNDNDEVIARAIARGIKQAEKDVSIAIPIISDGSRLWQPHVAVNIITKALHEVNSLHHVIRVVLQDSNQLAPFLTSMLDTSCKVQLIPDVTHVFDTAFPLPVSSVSIGDVSITVTPLSKQSTKDVMGVVRELKKRLGVILIYHKMDI